MSTSYDTELDDETAKQDQEDLQDEQESQQDDSTLLPAATVVGETPSRPVFQPSLRPTFQPSTRPVFQPSAKTDRPVFQPRVLEGVEQPKDPALRLAQETAAQYKPPTTADLPRIVAGETARAFQDQGAKEDTATLQNLEEAKQGNLPGLIKYLEKNQVVAPEVQKAYLADLKANGTKAAQDYWGIKDPTAAYSKLMSDVTPLDLAGEVWNKIIPNVQSALTSWNQSQETVDENRFMRFVKAISPNVTPDRLIAFKNNLASMRPADRSAFMYDMLRESGQLDPTTGAAPSVGDMALLADSTNRILDPKWQADQAAGIKAQQEQNEKNLAQDPRLKGTAGGFVAENLAQLPKNVLEAVIPGFGQSLMASEIYQSTLQRVKQENPNLSEEDQKAKASASTLYQLGGAELLNLTTGGFLGGVTGNIKNTFARVIASTGVHAGVGGTAGAIQQISGNLAEGRPLFQDVPESVIGGLIQGVPGGFIGGLTHKPEPEAKVPLRPQPETEPKLGEPAPPTETETGPKGGEKTGPETGTLEEGGVKPAPLGETTPPTADEATVTEPTTLPEEPRREVTTPADELDQTELNNEELVRQADELYDRNKTEIALGGVGEEKPAEVAPRGQEPAGTLQPVSDLGGNVPVREAAVSPVSEPTVTDRGVRTEQPPTGREPAPSEGAVQPQLGPVQGLLERKLSGAERKTFQPEIQALEAAPRSASDPVFQTAYQALREKVIGKFQDLLNAAGIKRYENPMGDGMASHIDSNTGELSLETNLPKEAQQVVGMLNRGEDPLNYIHSSVQEEMIHAAHQKVLYDDWVAGGKQGRFEDHVKDRAEQMYSEMFRARDNALARGQTKLAGEIEAAIKRSWPTYELQPGYDDEAFIKSQIESGNLKDVALRAFELVRQLMQIKSGNPLTEESFRSVWQRARDWLTKIRDNLAGLYKRLGPGKALAKTELGRMVRAVDAEIKAMDAKAKEWNRKGTIEERLRSEDIVPRAPGEITEDVKLRGAGAEEGKREDRKRYEGAPPGVTDARSLRRLKDRLIKFALEGEAFRKWYEEGAHPMMRGVGFRPDRYERLMANIAASSPQNKVYPNFGMAARAYAQQAEGGRRVTIGKGAAMMKKLAAIGRGDIWKGVKTNQFYRDHMAVFDKRLEQDMGSTMDMHMARAFGYPTDGFSAVQSQWAQGIMREITKELGWEKPKHTQAAIWSAIKARFESVWPKYRDMADAAGDRIQKGKKIDFKDAETERQYRTPALKEAYSIEPPDLTEAAFNFGDALKRDLGTASYETRPSADVQAQNPWMKLMSPADWDEYHRQATAIVTDANGVNKLVDAANLISLGEHEGYSAWGSENNLSQQVAIVMSKASGKVLKLAGEKFKVDPTIEHQVRDFAAATGLLYQQDGVGYHRPYWAGTDSGVTRKAANGVDIRIGRPLTAEETTALTNALNSKIPSYEKLSEKEERGWFVSPHENGIRVVSYGHPDGNKIFDAVSKTADAVLPDDLRPGYGRFASYGDLLSNNWKTQSNGEGYRSWLTSRRRSDILGLVDGVLRPQIDRLNAEWEQRKTGAESAISPESPGRSEGAITPQAPSLKENWDRFKTWYSTRVKGGESAMMDWEETQPVGVALRRHPSMKQRVAEMQRTYPLEQAFKDIPRKELPRVTKEFTDYVSAEQNKKPLPKVSSDTMRLIQAGKDSLEATGKIIQQLKVMVRDGNTLRPIRLIGRDFFPRIISKDTEDIFNNRDGTRRTEFDQLVNDAIARGVVKNRDEFVDKFTNAITGKTREVSDDYHARKLDLPLQMYDQSPETLLRYLNNQTEKLGRIAVAGQKLGPHGKTIFDRATEAVQKSGKYDYRTKQAIIDRIEWERQRFYKSGREEPLSTNMRQLSSGIFLGNPLSSMYNFLSGHANNYVHGGPVNFAKAVMSFPKGKQLFAEARTMNLLRNNLRDHLQDFETVTDPGWLSKGIRGFTGKALTYGGQNLTENLNRVFAMQTAKLILQDFLKTHGVKTSAIIRDRDAQITRRFGFQSSRSPEAQQLLDRLAAEKGNGKLTNEFIRQFVLDVHGSYEQAQAPAHIFDNPAGKIITQFQKYGANSARIATREYLMPLDDAIKHGNAADVGYQFIRNLHFLAAATGAGAIQQMLANFLFRRDPSDPTFAEIGKAIMEGRNADAAKWMLTRAWGAFLLSGFSGLFGNYVDLANNYIGTSRGRLKDPMHPPAFGLIDPFVGFMQGWLGEMGDGRLKLPSAKLFSDLADKWSMWRVMSRMGLAVGAYIPTLTNQWSREYAAKQDSMFLKNRIAMFAEQNPTIQAKQATEGTRAATISMAGRSPFDPYRDKIIGGLMTGNAHQVTDSIRDYLATLPKGTDVKAVLDQIRSVIDSNSPMKIGGSTKADMVNQFLSWAKTNLPEGEARRVFALAHTYLATSLESGLEPLTGDKVQMVKGLDFDKYKPPKALPAAVQKAQDKATEIEGKASLKEMIIQQKIAEKLLQHH